MYSFSWDPKAKVGHCAGEGPSWGQGNKEGDRETCVCVSGMGWGVFVIAQPTHREMASALERLRDLQKAGSEQQLGGGEGVVCVQQGHL